MRKIVWAPPVDYAAIDKAAEVAVEPEPKKEKKKKQGKNKRKDRVSGRR